MSRLQSIKPKTTVSPARVLIYGIEGVGKTTFASKAPKPIFITPEGGTNEIPGAVEMPGVKTFSDVCASVKELLTEKHDYETVIIDSVDWVEKLCHAHIIGNKDRSIITVNGGYGAGYRESEQLHRALVSDLQALRDEKKMNVIAIGHYHVKTVKDPEAVNDYDAFEIKCHEFVSSLWREWVDAVLFARFRTHLKTDERNQRTVALGDGERVMYTEKRPAFQAKNRYGLPFELPVSWDAFCKARSKASELQLLLSEIREYYEVSPEDVKAGISKSVIEAQNDIAKLRDIRDRAKQTSKLKSGK